MKQKQMLFTIVPMFAACLAFGGAYAADETSKDAAPAGSKPEQHIMMDHSAADGKAMRMMKDKKPKIHTAGEEAAHDSSNDGETHVMMDHSAADGKAMRNMKDKTVKTHKAGDKTAQAADQPCEEHIMMDHSAADGKAMRNMKDKTVKSHKSGNCDQKPATDAK